MDNLVFSNMLHRPARTAVSIIGISVGVLLIVFTVGLTNGSMRERASREGNVGAEIFFRAGGGFAGNDALTLPVTLKQQLESVEGIQTALAVAQNTVSTEDNNTGSRLIDGIVFDDYSKLVGINIVEGRKFNENADEILIDTGFQRQKKYKIGDKMKLYERDFTIVGTYEPAAGARVKMPLSVMQNQLGAEGKVSAFLVKIKPGFEEAAVAKNIQDKFPDNTDNSRQPARRALYVGDSGDGNFSQRRHRRGGGHFRARHFADDVHDRHRTNAADRRDEILGNEQFQHRLDNYAGSTFNYILRNRRGSFADNRYAIYFNPFYDARG